ncbi:Protein of unknown function [Chitinophaga jiangningensis]|uniref:DUF3822 family protein n=1 Tax=Chitinophaga jiangningensis TaxID=1419482 RepID=A0A1M6YMK0_9BACT|nr:DUF3822 family protein [Chitinophaga jiangningensis]SHL19315.1 Protein of unknown function [Chitinophaga jiangningensis]
MPVAYNIHPAFTVDDETLLETDLTACHLLVLVGSGTFSYVVYEPVAKKFLALKSYHFQPQKIALADLEMIEEVFEVDKLLFTAFRSVLLAFDTGSGVLVPQQYFNAGLKKDYLHLVQPEKVQEAVLSDLIYGQPFVNVYSLDKDLVGFLRKEFSSDLVIHASSALLLAYPMDFDFNNEKGIAFVEVQRNAITITIYKAGKLLIHQEAEYQSGLDVVYTVVNTLRLLGMDEKEVKVKLSGALVKDNAVYQEMYKFIPNLEWAQRLPGFSYISKMQEIPGYYFHNLYALALCV